MVYNSIKETLHTLNDRKMNLIVLYLLPILLVIMMGVELNSEVISDLPIAIIDNDQTDFSHQLVDAFDQNIIFGEVSYPKDQATMEKMIKNSEVRVGLIIPKGFYDDVVALKSPTALMVYDGSHMAITGTAKAKATEILLTFKAGAAISQIGTRLGISKDEAVRIANVFSFQNRVLYNPAKSYEDFLAPILMAGYIQAALALTASVGINHDIYKKKSSERLGYAFGKILTYTIVGVLSYNVCIALQVGIFKLPFRGDILSLEMLIFGLCFAVSAFCILISTVIRKRVVALIAGGVVFIPNSIMAGTTWPLISMPVGYQAFAKYTPFMRFIQNFRNAYLKGYGLDTFGKDVAYLFIFGGVVLLITELVLVIANQEEREDTKDGLHRDIQETVSVNI